MLGHFVPLERLQNPNLFHEHNYRPHLAGKVSAAIQRCGQHQAQQTAPLTPCATQAGGAPTFGRADAWPTDT